MRKTRGKEDGLVIAKRLGIRYRLGGWLHRITNVEDEGKSDFLDHLEIGRDLSMMADTVVGERLLIHRKRRQ